MRIFRKVAIVGVGLIGGSLALSIKKHKLASQVVGVSRHASTLDDAKKRGAIDAGSRDIKIIKDADLVILAAPVETIIKLAPSISKIIRKDCIVTDVGSTKQEIVNRLGKIFPNFVGAHPLAGSEKKGVVNADAGIFKNSLCIVTSAKNSNPSALKKVQLLWRAVGAKTLDMTAAGHDRTLSFISHLPHVAAFSLINSVPQDSLKLASSGLKDTTRIAASDAILWRDIFLSNRKNVLKAIGILEKNITAIKHSISGKDAKALTSLLKKAQRKRKALE